LPFYAFVITFVVVFIAELPDKSMLASMVMASRSRRLPVWAGATAAFTLHATLAAAAGGLLASLPKDPLALGVAALLGAIGVLFIVRGDSDSDGDDEVGPKVRLITPTSPFMRIATVAFVAIAVAELGDFTQLTTATLAARFDAPVAVGLAALLAESSCAALGVTVGAKLSDRLPAQLMVKVAGGLLILVALVTVFSVARG